MKNLNITLNFDMDGTIADLYGVENWLYYLENEMVFPYENAQPLLRLASLAKRLNHLQRKGFKIAIISWTSKSGDKMYHDAVSAVKREWLAKHMPSVQWDEIHIVPYGTPKETFCESEWDILFDDEAKNRDSWTGLAFDESQITNVLSDITNGLFKFLIENLD